MALEQFKELLLLLIALVLSVCVHEFGHAFMAVKLGDDLPRRQGRLTLNPLAHADPVGTLLFPALAMYLSMSSGAGRLPLLGWGRPVQTNTLAYTRRLTRRTGHMLVAIAGPTMNLILATILSVIVVLGARFGVLDLAAGKFVLSRLVSLNLVLLFFNLLPVPPLDGGAVLAWILPTSLQHVVEFLERWGFMILLALLLTPALGFLMRPAYHVIGLWLNVVLRLAYA